MTIAQETSLRRDFQEAVISKLSKPLPLPVFQRGKAEQAAWHWSGSRLSSSTAEVTFPADGPGPLL